jgi:multimeric flavodoxin WrbA
MPEKKILVIAGSPRRHGNSTILAETAAEAAREAGADVEVIHLGELSISPCTACDACRKNPNGGCIIQDDMVAIYPKLEEVNGLILASPVYWFTMSAQLKAFIDRTYAMGEGEKYGLGGKSVGIIMTYADADLFSSGAVNALRTFQDIFAYVESKIVGIVHGSAEKAGDIQSNEAVLTQAAELGKNVATACQPLRAEPQSDEPGQNMPDQSSDE